MWLSDYNGSSFWQVICHFSIECFGAGKGAISQWMVARHIGEKKKSKFVHWSNQFKWMLQTVSPSIISIVNIGNDGQTSDLRISHLRHRQCHKSCSQQSNRIDEWMSNRLTKWTITTDLKNQPMNSFPANPLLVNNLSIGHIKYRHTHGISYATIRVTCLWSLRFAAYCLACDFVIVLNKRQQNYTEWMVARQRKKDWSESISHIQIFMSFKLAAGFSAGVVAFVEVVFVINLAIFVSPFESFEIEEMTKKWIETVFLLPIFSPKLWFSNCQLLHIAYLMLFIGSNHW